MGARGTARAYPGRMCAFEPEYASEPRHAPERPCAPEPEYAFQPGYRDPAELLAAAAGCTARRDPRRAELIGRLQRRTDAAAFAAAAEAARSADLALRVVAMEVLGQLGYPADRPYREQTLPILLAEIDQAVEPRLLQTAITATAHLGDGRALAPVLRHAGHRDALVRRAVAFTLPTLVDPAEPAPAVRRRGARPGRLRARRTARGGHPGAARGPDRPARRPARDSRTRPRRAGAPRRRLGAAAAPPSTRSDCHTFRLRRPTLPAAPPTEFRLSALSAVPGLGGRSRSGRPVSAPEKSPTQTRLAALT